ncbi:MAG: hypothetical protein KatS3mg021_1433 [Fimbriimonadales bacterium]|nr:MAG: hypothetical protein KatS3mg021_1433 [Fimbriimonadales bacterium]
MKPKKHFVQWLVITALYWMAAYTIASLVSWVYYVWTSIPQTTEIQGIVLLPLAAFELAFIFNPFLFIDLIVILPAGILWVISLFLSRPPSVKVLVVALWSVLMALCLYFADGVLISLHSLKRRPTIYSSHGIWCRASSHPC